MFNNLLPISSTGFVQPQIQALPYDDSDDAPSFEHRQLQEEVTRLRAQEAQLQRTQHGGPSVSENEHR